jgi:5'(3')-deoxyribonucleotidase
VPNGKQVVALDLDDVVVDFFQGVIDAMGREFAVFIDKADVTEWDKNPVKEFAWKDYGWKSWWDWMQERDWLWSTFPAIPGAIGSINALREAGHEPELLTSKPKWAESQVWTWLGRWKPAVNRVTITDLETPKHRRSDADVLVDDKPSNVLDWLKSDKHREAILFDQPWNRSVDVLAPVAGGRLWRAKNWEDVLRIIDLMEADL